MDKFLHFIEKNVVPITEKIGGQRHLQAIRDGVISVLPLILIGSFFLLVAQPPGKYLSNLVKPYLSIILIPYRLTYGLISIYAVLTISYFLAKSYKMEGISTSILSLVSFFMVASLRVMIEGKVTLPHNKSGVILPIKYFGNEGLFLAIVIAILVVEALRYLKGKKLMFTMPSGVPEGVTKAFESMIPAFLIILAFWGLRDILLIDIPSIIIQIFSPIKKLGDTFGAVFTLSLIDSVVWFAGIHPVSIIGPFARPIWLQLLTENADMVAKMGHSVVLPHIAVDQFYFWFVWVGGSGASLGLVLHLLFAKSKFLRQLGKMCILPGLFNINEPLIFGLPIVANPLMIIPFTLAPLLGGLISYIAFYFNLVQRPYIMAPWTLPAPIGAFVSTGGDWRAALLSLIVIFVSFLIYMPFIKVYDAKMKKKEEEDGE